MAVTIKRKSLKKSLKKNVRSRKLGNKTRKNNGHMRGGKPQKPVYAHVEKKHLTKGFEGVLGGKHYKKRPDYKKIRGIVDTHIGIIAKGVKRKLSAEEVSSIIQISKEHENEPRKISAKVFEAHPGLKSAPPTAPRQAWEGNPYIVSSLKELPPPPVIRGKKPGSTQGSSSEPLYTKVAVGPEFETRLTKEQMAAAIQNPMALPRGLQLVVAPPVPSRDSKPPPPLPEKQTLGTPISLENIYGVPKGVIPGPGGPRRFLMGPEGRGDIYSLPLSRV